jgi:hypothetical protein
MIPGPEPIANLTRRVATRRRQELELAALAAFNESHQSLRRDDPRLAAGIKSFETAFGMQIEMPAALDLSQETDATLNLYGLPRGSTEGFAWQCLVARRLVERGVRFVELIDTGSSGGNWDSHGIRPVDKPVHVHDFHATILHLVGLDHTRLTFRHAGRDYRLTDVHGNVVRELVA